MKAKVTFHGSIALVIASILPALAGPAFGQGAVSCPREDLRNEYAKIVAFLLPASQVGNAACRNSKVTDIKCDDMVVKGSLFPETYYIFVAATDGDREAGFGGIQFGISYNAANRQGVDVYGWQNCGALEFPMAGWPNSGTGDLVTWEVDHNCQQNEPGGSGTGVVAVAGYFYVAAYSPDTFKITVRQNDGLAKVANCGAAENCVEGPGVMFSKPHLGYVSFSDGATVQGYNPCGLTKPKEETTWSGVKSRDNK